MNNPPKTPGYYWLIFTAGPPGHRQRHAQPVYVYDSGAGYLVYTRCGYYKERPVTESPDGHHGWRWGAQIQSPVS